MTNRITGDRKVHSRHNRLAERYGIDWMIAVALLDGSAGIDHIVNNYDLLIRRFGLFLEESDHKRPEEADVNNIVAARLTHMIENGWLKPLEDETYTLTETGRSEGEKLYTELILIGSKLRTALSPVTVSIITLITHLILAAIKLPAACISGSVGLLNDGIDTLIDAVSSLLVFFGIRSRKERLANRILILIMLITGSFTLYEAVRRIFTREPIESGSLAVISTLISAVLSLILMFYQRIVGRQSSSEALLTQSIDSRNHIFTAIGVLLGLTAMMFDFIWLDILIGLTVAAFICKTAIELLINQIQHADEEIDIDRFQILGYDRMRELQLRRKLMKEIDIRHFDSVNALKDYALSLFSLHHNPYLRALGLVEIPHIDHVIETTVDRMIELDLISCTAAGVTVTESGRVYRDRYLRKHERGRVSSNVLYTRIVIGSIQFAVICTVSILIIHRFSLFTTFPTEIIWDDGALSVLPLLQVLLSWILYIHAATNLQESSRRLHRVRRGREEPRELLTDGIYARSRHPMYGSMIILRLALGAALGNPIVVLFMILFCMSQVISTILEDRRLSRQFGDEFSQYRQATPHLLFTPFQSFSAVLLLILNCRAIILWAIS